MALTDKEKEDQLQQITNLQGNIAKLNQMGVRVQELKDDNIKLGGMEVPIDIHSKNPAVFEKALKVLSSDERKGLSMLLGISQKTIAYDKETYNAVKAILTNQKPLMNDDKIKAGIKKMMEANVKEYDKVLEDYDKLNIEITKVKQLNPLDVLTYDTDNALLQRTFQQNANQMLKLITKFFVKFLVETKAAAQRSRKGKLDFSKTIHESMKYGGTPYELKYRSHALRIRQVKPKIYFLIDISGSQEHGIYLSVAFAYACAVVLKEYDVVIYSSSDYLDKDSYKDIQLAEKRNLSGTNIVAGDSTIRLNKKTLIENINNPHELYSMINAHPNSTANDMFYIAESLADISPENSLFILLGDEHQMTSSTHQRAFNSAIPDKARKLMKKQLRGKVFYFCTDGFWTSTAYQKVEREFNFVPYSPSNYNFEDVYLFPRGTEKGIIFKNFTYGDWSREILKVIAGLIRKVER